MSETTISSVAPIRAILFDKDGTLIDFDRTWFEISRELAQRSAAGDKELARELLDQGGYDWETKRFRPNSVIAAGTVADIVSLWHPDVSETEHQALIRDYDEYGVQHGARSAVGLDGLVAALQALKQAGFKLGIATNDSEAGARATAEALGIADLFSAILGYDTAARAKPHADPLLHFAALVGVEPEQVAMVGDNPHDMECARAANAGLAVGVLTGNSSHEVLAPLADIVLNSMTELPSYFAANQ